MPNFEQQEGFKIDLKKIITKKHLIIGWIVLTLFLAGTTAYEFGWKKLESSIYTKGVEAGKAELNTLVIQQLLTTGRMGINIPMNEQGQYDPNGVLKTIFLAPIQNNSTTTK